MELARLEKELDSAKSDRRDLEFRFREMTSLSQINNVSFSSDENFADIAEELSATKALAS